MVSPRPILAIVFVLFAVWSLWIAKGFRWRLAFLAAFLAVAVWFITIQPSHDRLGRPEFGVMPHVTVDGDLVTSIGVRNFTSRPRDDFDVKYETRQVRLSDLKTVDLILSHWSIGPVGHTFLSFSFENSPPICVSIETRPEIGERFAPIASMFKQLELIYLVGTEQDLIGSRAAHRNEEGYLYRIKLQPLAARLLFLVPLERINQLHYQPEFYHLLKNSCTVNIVRHANTIGREGPWDPRHLLNGWVDRHLYDVGLLYN